MFTLCETYWFLSQSRFRSSLVLHINCMLLIIVWDICVSRLVLFICMVVSAPSHNPVICSLIDRRGFLSLDEAIPAVSASEIELPPFTVKSDAHMVG